MALCEAKLDVTMNSSFCDITRQHPDSRIQIWCNAHLHMYEFHSEDSSVMDQLESVMVEGTRWHTVFRSTRSMRLLSTECDCGPENISTILEDQNCWYVQPLVFQGGKAHYRVICQGREGIRRAVNLMRRNGYDVELASLKDLDFSTFANEMFVSSSNLLSGVTGKQLGVLAEAYSRGYFDEPAKVDIETLAKEAGLSRSTYSEHLRKAEARLLSNLAPIIKISLD